MNKNITKVEVISISKVKQKMDDKKRKFMIEISVSFHDDEEYC